jgi:hypothetical protein
MSDELSHFTSDELLNELVTRQNFAGIIIWDASYVGRIDTKLTKSVHLSRQDTERLLRTGMAMVPGMFGEFTSSGNPR